MVHRKTKPVDSELVLQKIRYFCSYQERCIRDVEGKLKDWTVQKRLIPSIIKSLKDEGYVDEERFAKVYAGGKFRVNKWGRERIGFELRLKGIGEDLIAKGLEEIDGDDYHKVLKELILKKKKEFLQENDFPVREKIINFVHGKGYEFELILSIIKELKI
ncbi:MAG: regulatory protein RecX [Bacteroidetes bacterium]|nr:regulatory protein RecX [Bacteroidota bacterium]